MIESNLKSHLDKRNISIRQAARDIDYRFESVRKMYNNEGRTYPKDLLDKLCTYLSVSPGDLILHKIDTSE